MLVAGAERTNSLLLCNILLDKIYWPLLAFFSDDNPSVQQIIFSNFITRHLFLPAKETVQAEEAKIFSVLRVQNNVQ